MANPKSANSEVKVSDKAVVKNDYLSLANFLLGGENGQRTFKRDPSGEAAKATAELYGNREYVAAYECFKPAYDKVAADMQRVLARGVDFEANKLAQRQNVSLTVAKERVQNIRAHAQQVLDQFNRLLSDLESKPLVRAFIKKGGRAAAATEIPADAVIQEPPPTTLKSTTETWVETSAPAPVEVESGGRRFIKAAYAPPEKGSLYSVRDKVKGDRIIRVIATNSDNTLIQVEVLEDGKPAKQPLQLSVDSLTKQAAKGWCSLLVPVTVEEGEREKISSDASETRDAESANITLRLDSQNFGRCCGDIVRANIKFGTQLIKDVCDGPFRAGNYEQAFLTFEQLAVGFNSAVANSRRAITDGRRTLTSEKGKLSGKEIQERTAGFTRSENLIHTAEREFATILEGLRMYLRARAMPAEQGESG
jgi:hypothetical protein